MSTELTDTELTDIEAGPNTGPPAAPRRGRAPKRAAIMRAARRVFGRDGYARASIDAIAAEAAVSTRTIYNHFANKEQLFAEVLTASATEVADGFVAAVARVMADPPDLEADLVALGEALAAQRTDNVEHFAMMEQINNEAAHFPESVLAAWREAGPLRVRREVADQLRRLASAGLLRVDDADRAARHFVAITSAEITQGRFPAPDEPSKQQVSAAVTAGVRAYLDGYRGRP